MKAERAVGLALFLLCVSPSLAHHSFSSEYNITAQIVLKGEITSIDWSNPHVFVTIAVRDSNSVLQEWHVEGGAVSFLKESGWTVEMLRQLVKSHETVVIAGYRARKNVVPAYSAWGKEIELQDGRKLPFN
jgi:Family of unknown function (DUF6152)